MSSCGVAASADGVGHSGLVLYVNGEYRDDSDIGKLMHDFNCTSAEENNRNGQCIVRFAYDMLAFCLAEVRGSQKWGGGS